MTNDSSKGWRYKLETDRNQRLRRQPEVRARIRTFKERAERKCSSRSRAPHGGELEVHHVGGIKKAQEGQRLAYMCEDHNRADAGQAPHGRKRPARGRPRRRGAIPVGVLLVGAAVAVAWLLGALA